MAKEVEMLVGVSGIYVFYLLYGIVQERVTTTPFGPNGERFDFMFFLVCLQCILNALFALIGTALHCWLRSCAIELCPPPLVAAAALCRRVRSAGI
jgi:hypothetical protein